MKTSSLQKSRVGITLGDPAGIGPEIIAKALANTEIQNLANFTLIGDSSIFEKYFKQLPKNIHLFDLKQLNGKLIKPGIMDPLAAKASLAYLDKAISLLKEECIDTLVTGPLCKEAVSNLGTDFTGHTEYLAKAFNVEKFEMMFICSKMRLIIATRHIPLKNVSQYITKEKILETIFLGHEALMNSLEIEKPKIAVCGLNPHAGEGGHIGKEEIEAIIPAIVQAQNGNINVKGPFAADTLFRPNIGNEYDLIIAMYHDQGLVAAKTLVLRELVNLTIGLPFIRTSPAHGTAFDIAGKNIADPSSIIQAIRVAAQKP